MKKLLILLLSVLIIVSLILAYTLYLSNKPAETIVKNYDDLKSKILNNSEWYSLSSDDLNSYLFNSYTSTVEKIIISLEESVPVIFKIYGDRFSNAKNGSFVVASAFTPNNDVYIYYYDFSKKEYIKKPIPLSSLLDSATSVFILKNLEVLK